MNNIKLKLVLFLLLLIGHFFCIASAQENLQTNAQTNLQQNLQAPLTSGGEVIFRQQSYPISAVDPTILNNSSASFYPGLRGANQMTVYTPVYGLRTNTNEFGSEVIVNGNVVTALSGADSLIPRDGLVISGHGLAKKWMNENIILGSKVYVNQESKNLTVYITSESFLFGARAVIREAQDISNYYKCQSYMYDSRKPDYYISKAQDYLQKAQKDPHDVQKYSSLAIEAANSALAYSIPHKSDELKGVWIRPTETSEHEIINTLNRIHDTGINNIFLETYFHGKTIFPSKTMENYQFTSQNEKFLGFDPLKVWIEEAHKRNIKVNIWFETFYVGNTNPNANSKSIIAVNPNWANTTKRDFDSGSPTPSLSEHGGYFIDPANPDVQEFLQDLICEIVDNYCPDGINLDYIRYPQSISAKFSGYDLSNWGYTEYARCDFKSRYGIDPIDITPNDEAWALWCKYRQDKITSFVLRIGKITRSRNILLTTVIFPDRQKALETKQQDWKTWSVLGYVDGFTPLLLTCDPKTASVMMQDVIKNKCQNTALYAGLFITFMGGSSEDLMRQIHEARKVNAKGEIVFDYAHMSDKYINTLTASVFEPEKISLPILQTNTPEPKAKKRFFHLKKI